MAFTAGTRLGPYEIVSRIGAGGMGEVWRAHDTRLERDVAVKVLPATLANDAHFRARFQREAKAISQLNHPHICQIYDVGEVTLPGPGSPASPPASEGILGEQKALTVSYIVMELLEGETLAERIGRGALPLSDVLRHGVQMSEALAAAHRAGIVHRDLKPGNVMITRSGAKLLDFGLAKLQAAEVPSDPSALTERHDPLTARGVIVGTIPYMSPEQLQGKALDHRTDIFSLGVILYEMTTGRRPFPGNTGEAVLAGILSSDPDAIHSLQPSAPPALGQIIVTALEKDPEQRWQTAHDVARQLRWISETGSAGQRAALAPRRILPVWALALGAAVAALLTFAATRYFSSPAEKRPLRLHLAPPSGMQFLSAGESTGFALSPDGETLCFSALSGNGTALYLRRLDSTEATKVEGTERSSGPFWSSNGEWVGFSARGKLWKTKISGGVPEAVCDVGETGAVATWVDSTILFADRPGGRKEIFRVSALGGTPTPLTTIAPGEWRHTWPQLLPDGEHFVYQSLSTTSMERQLILASLSSTKRSVLLKDSSRAMPVGGDQLVYVRDGTLLMQRFNLAKGVPVGDPSALGANVFYFYATAGADFSASSKGTVVYRTTGVSGRLVLRDRSGLETAVIDEKGPFQGSHSVSPDGKKAAVTVKSLANGSADIWIYDLTRSLRERLTSEPGVEVFPVWSPDGRSIVYSNAQGGSVPHLVRRSLSDSQPEELAPRGSFQVATSFSPDGLSVYYSSTTSRINRDLFRLSIRTKIAEAVLRTSADESEPEVSPDGRWMAYSSSSGGAPEIYLHDLTGNAAEKVRVSDKNGVTPRWRSDGKELFYLTGEVTARTVMSATQRVPGDWSNPILKELFRVPADVVGFDVLPDGQSFLISDQTPGEFDALFHVIVGVK